MSKILVTGGTGFLGAHILYYLTNNNESPIALKRKNSCFKKIKNIFLKHGDSNLILFKKIKWISQLKEFYQEYSLQAIFI